MNRYAQIPNRCPICEVKIMDVCSRCKRSGRVLENNIQFILELSSGESMYVALCKKCHYKAADGQIEGVWQGLKEWFYSNGQPEYLLNNVTIKKIRRDKTA